MEDKKETAKQVFQNGFNCAQAVLVSFSSELGIDRETALRISSGFGAGMGRLQNTCGAVAGAYMVIGYLHGKFKEDDYESREKAYSLIRSFARDFNRIHRSDNCSILLDCDLNTEEGAAEFKEKNYHETRCLKYVQDAVQLLEEKYIKC